MLDRYLRALFASVELRGYLCFQQDTTSAAASNTNGRSTSIPSPAIPASKRRASSPTIEQAGPAQKRSEAAVGSKRLEPASATGRIVGSFQAASVTVDVDETSRPQPPVPANGGVPALVTPTFLSLVARRPTALAASGCDEFVFSTLSFAAVGDVGSTSVGSLPVVNFEELSVGQSGFRTLVRCAA
jgi:hypothetical protein